VLERKPGIVGFTVYPTNYCSCQLIARTIKESDPSIIILFGGPTPTVQARTILERNPWVDICARNEAEETGLQLVSLLETHGFDLDKALSSLHQINGISFRVDGHIRENPPADILINHRKIPGYLDKYPSPYISGVLDSADLGVVTARGCTRHCTYCNCAVISKRIIAAHSVERVIEELDFIATRLVTEQTRKVDVFDDAFTLWPDRALEICNRLIENNIRLPLSCITRCDTVNEELLEKMKEAGFYGVGFALESAVPRILRLIGKVQPPWTKADPHYERETEFIEKLAKYVTYARRIGFTPDG
jgi:radical SAM superfamily enzyme YgiQ (UPF0313 family)